MNELKNKSWKVRFEVTFYGNDSKKGNFREIKIKNREGSQLMRTLILKIKFHLITLKMLKLIFYFG